MKIDEKYALSILKNELKDLNFVLTAMMFLNTVFLLIIAFS